jgi:hypothetical protein
MSEAPLTWKAKVTIRLLITTYDGVANMPPFREVRSEMYLENRMSMTEPTRRELEMRVCTAEVWSSLPNRWLKITFVLEA